MRSPNPSAANGLDLQPSCRRAQSEDIPRIEDRKRSADHEANRLPINEVQSRIIANNQNRRAIPRGGGRGRVSDLDLIDNAKTIAVLIRESNFSLAMDFLSSREASGMQVTPVTIPSFTILEE